jgi:hypothetical protein
MTGHIFITQLEKYYSFYLKGVILGLPFQPIVLRGGKNKPDTTVTLHEQIRIFQAFEKKENKKGWTIEWEEWVSKKLGRQQWPAVITVNTADDFLFLLKKEKEALAFNEQLKLLLQWRPAIKDWLANKPALVLDLSSSWPGICAVVDYLLNHDVSHHYLRSIPVPVHTKFIEQHKKVIHAILHYLNNEKFPLPDTDLEEALGLNRKPFLFPVRWLDNNLALRYTAGINPLAVSGQYLQQQAWSIERVILVENTTNLYLFPSIPNTLVICSHGKALHLLKEIPFLQNTELYYWGDLDEDGFAMLNAIRSYYDHITSLFMDDVTITCHQAELTVKGITYRKRELDLLQPHENRAYQLLLPGNLWLEQEKLHQSYIQAGLRKWIPEEIR